MSRPVRWPGARWTPSPNFGYTKPNGQPVILVPLAYVQHSAHTPLMSSPPERFFTKTPPAPQKPGSVHLWFYGNGAVDQLVELDKPAYGNGQLNRNDGLQSPSQLVRSWYRARRNPNWDTWSGEFTGYGETPPSVTQPPQFSRPTDEQMDSFVRFSEWSKAEGWMDFGASTLLLHRQISATACPDGRFTVEDLLLALGDAMSSAEYDRLVKAIFGTQERMDWLRDNGIAEVEARVTRFENDDGPIGTRLTDLEELAHSHQDDPAGDLPSHQHEGGDERPHGRCNSMKYEWRVFAEVAFATFVAFVVGAAEVLQQGSFADASADPWTYIVMVGAAGARAAGVVLAASVSKLFGGTK